MPHAVGFEAVRSNGGAAAARAAAIRFGTRSEGTRRENTVAPAGFSHALTPDARWARCKIRPERGREHERAAWREDPGVPGKGPRGRGEVRAAGGRRARPHRRVPVA